MKGQGKTVNVEYKCTVHIQKYLIIVVIEIRICALQLHHLDFGYPFLFFLSHQVTVGISTSAVSSSPTMISVDQKK